MKVLQINTVYPTGSTGRIAQSIYKKCAESNISVKTAYRYVEKEKYQETFTVSSYLDCHLHNRIVRINMRCGMYSRIRTRRFLRKVKDYNPDIIHLHNLHGNYINLPLLFKYIKKEKKAVIWTLHDCWAFTGFCAHFDMIGCDKWKTQCQKCPQFKCDKWNLFDSTKKMHLKKKAMFTGVENMTIVTPSEWLARLAKQSYLSEYPIKVINNGIDLSIFKPRESEFRERYNCKDNFIVLGVAAGWGKRKGFDVFLNLAKRLDDRYKIVLVGTNENIDKYLPSNVISIHKTENQTALAEIYSAADVFVNPTREENFPTVNMESLACGTPVVTFNTGGSPEIIDENCGIVVEKNDVDGLEKSVKHVCENKPFSQENCIVRANKFDKENKFEEYIDLYKEIVGIE